MKGTFRQFLRRHSGNFSFTRMKRGFEKIFETPGSVLCRQTDSLLKLTKFKQQSSRTPRGKFDTTRMQISWIIPDFSPGAGGHMTIFRIASRLESYGHEVRFLIRNPSIHLTEKGAKNTINSHFQPFYGRVELLGNELPFLEGDALIATDHLSCYPAQALSGFRRKFYFVQDYETSFYSMGSKALLAECTYSMGFDCLCAGDWLADIVKEKFSGWAMSWPLAYDPQAYFPNPQRKGSSKRIAFYSRFTTERRAVELGMMALSILHSKRERFHVDFFGYPLIGLKVPYSYTDHGILNPSELGKLYRGADLGIVFSATNHSLVNREMMACGLPVVDLDVEGVRRVFPDNVLWRVKPHPEAIASDLQLLLNDNDGRERLSKAGLAHIKDLSWDKSARLIERTLASRIAGDI